MSPEIASAAPVLTWPGWVGPVLLAAMMLGAGLGIFQLFKPITDEPGLVSASWPERAAHAAGVRAQERLARTLAVVVPMMIGVPGGDLGWAIPREAVWAPCGLLLLVVTLTWGARRVAPVGGRWPWVAQRLVDGLGFLPWIVGLYGVALLPNLVGVSWMAGAVALELGLMAEAGRWRFAALGLRRPVSSRLEAALARAQTRAGHQAPVGLIVVDLAGAEAWASVLTGDVVVSERLVDGLDDDALTAVLCHELAHLREPWWMGGYRLLWLPSVLVAAAGLWLGLVHHNPWSGLTLTALLPALVFRRPVLREAERRADRAARSDDFTRAIRTLHELNLIPLDADDDHPGRAASTSTPPTPPLRLSWPGLLLIVSTLGWSSLGPALRSPTLTLLTGTDDPVWMQLWQQEQAKAETP